MICVFFVMFEVITGGDHQPVVLRPGDPLRTAGGGHVRHGVAQLAEIGHEDLASDQTEGHGGAVLETAIGDHVGDQQERHDEIQVATDLEERFADQVYIMC